MTNPETLLTPTLQNQSWSFYTTWGLFSPKDIDDGTRLLLENLSALPTDRIFDLGCGYGPIGIVLGKNAVSVDMVDKDFVAVEYAERNAKLNGLNQAKVYLSNAFSHVPKDAQFDLIVSNLPAKPGKEFFELMLQDAKAHLAPGGRIVVVFIAGLNDYIKRIFKEIFGDYKKITQAKGYTVAEARPVLK
jgi:16S rRNA G1207 methylase RsmC